MASVLRLPIPKICAWCSRMLVVGEWLPAPGTVVPDHATWTICPDCLASHYHEEAPRLSLG